MNNSNIQKFSIKINSKTSANKQDYRNMIAGFISSIVSRTICAPLDRVKMLSQVNYQGQDKPPAILNILKNIYFKEGFPGFFRGNLINLIKGSPEVGIKLYIFEKIKWKYQSVNNKQNIPNSFLFLSGVFSGMVANIIIFPLEVLKLRIGATDKKQCQGVIKTIKNIYKEPGGIINFYSGIEASLLSTIPNAGILLYSYEKLKIFVSGSQSIDNAKNLSPIKISFIGALSALIASVIIYPFQMVQARMIMLNVKGIKLLSLYDNKFGKTKLIASCYTIFKLEGFTGFYKGYTPAVIKTCLGNGIGFGVYEKAKETMGVFKM